MGNTLEGITTDFDAVLGRAARMWSGVFSRIDVDADEETLRRKTQGLATAAGLGFKLAWNENFILSLEFAHCFDPALGNGIWFDAGVNYVF